MNEYEFQLLAIKRIAGLEEYKDDLEVLEDRLFECYWAAKTALDRGNVPIDPFIQKLIDNETNT